MVAKIESVHRGKPKALRDERGEWVSSIARESVVEPVEVERGGIVGDGVAQPYHGSLDAAICVHLSDAYRFWSEQYGVDLKPGSMGENLVLGGVTESEVFVGDIVRVGTALLQVSGPRVPCANLARHVGRADWVKLTIKENRTGFYARVLEPGVVARGEAWRLEQRINDEGAIWTINHCFYLDFDAKFAGRALRLEGLGEWWKEQFREKLNGVAHWSGAMTG